MGETCVLGEDEAGGRYFTPPQLSTQSDIVTMLTFHLKAYKLQEASDQRQEKAKKQVKQEMSEKRANAPKLELKLTAQEWKRWRSSWARYKRYIRLTDQYACMDHRWGSSVKSSCQRSSM